MKRPLLMQFVVLGISVGTLLSLMVWLRLKVSLRYDNNDRYSVLNHPAASNFICVGGYDDFVDHAHTSDILPALAAALEAPTEATVDAALREMAHSQHGESNRLGQGLPGSDWVLSVALDPGLSKRIFKAASLPVLTPLFEAEYNTDEHEYDSGDLNFLVNHSASKEWAVRIGHLERQLDSTNLTVYRGDNDFPFRQGSLNMTNATWVEDNDTSVTALVRSTFWLLNRPIPHSDLWPLTKAPASVIVEPRYTQSSDMINAFHDGVFPTLGWPVLLEMHLLFGKNFVTVVRGTDGAVRYWALRNGTSSVSTGLRMNLTEDETAFLDEQVPLHLQGGASGGNMLFHSERLAQALGTPVLRADWLAFGAKGPRIHQLRYFWDHVKRSVNAGVGPQLGDAMARQLMDGFETRGQALGNVTAPGIDWQDCLNSVGCYQRAGQELDTPYCGCPRHRSDCDRPEDMGRRRATEL